MNKKSLSKFNRIELHVYEILGVRLFRRFILLFEKIKHHKDGRKNENYHLKGRSLTALRNFSGYLLYNTSLHIVSLILTLSYFIITRSLNFNYLWLDIFMYVTVLFNLYCIMLQRYIYLNIKSNINKLSIRRSQYIQATSDKISSFLGEKSNDEFLEEYRIIQKIYLCMSTGDDCVLSSGHADVLNRLAIVAERSELTSSPRITGDATDVTFHTLLSKLECSTQLNGRVSRYVSRVQNLLKRPVKDNVLFGYSIITEDPKCETAFCRLFPVRNREKMELTIAVLLHAYQQKGLAML